MQHFRIPEYPNMEIMLLFEGKYTKYEGWSQIHGVRGTGDEVWGLELDCLELVLDLGFLELGA